LIFWRWLERKDRDDQGRERIKRIPLLRYYTVFSTEQCDGIEVPTAPATTPTDFRPIERCENVLANMPQVPTITHNEGRAFYRPSTDTVSIPRPTLFTDPAAYYGVLWHELAHSTGHGSRLDRPGISESHFFGDADYYPKLATIRSRSCRSQ